MPVLVLINKSIILYLNKKRYEYNQISKIESLISTCKAQIGFQLVDKNYKRFCLINFSDIFFCDKQTVEK